MEPLRDPKTRDQNQKSIKVLIFFACLSDPGKLVIHFRLVKEVPVEELPGDLSGRATGGPGFKKRSMPAESFEFAEKP